MSDDELAAEEPAGMSQGAGAAGPSHADRIEAAFLGALAGERTAQAPAAAGDLLEVADSIASVGGFDADDLRNRGLTGSSQAGAAGLLLRAVPYGLLSPRDRPRIRHAAYRVATLAGADEGTAIAAIAAALLAADLTRFDPATAAVRVRQSLLEDAPLALLDRLRPDAASLAPIPATTEEAAIAGGAARRPAPDDDPGAALQVALTAVWGAESLDTAIRSAAQTGRRAATSLAGVFAGARLGSRDLDDEWRAALPHSHRASVVAAAVAARSNGIEDTATPPSAPPAGSGTLPSAW
jgi:hypothetical protein